MLQYITRKRDFKRAGKFGAVGLANTFIDFFIFNFCSKFLNLGILESNTISTTIAMVFSFMANRKLVFKDHEGSAFKQALKFYAVTAFSLYVIQNGIIHLLVNIYPEPILASVHIIRALGITVFNDAFYINNGAKVVGTVASLAWNYVVYKKVVLR